jgi:hypothetical protein
MILTRRIAIRIAASDGRPALQLFLTRDSPLQTPFIVAGNLSKLSVPRRLSRPQIFAGWVSTVLR